MRSLTPLAALIGASRAYHHVGALYARQDGSFVPSSIPSSCDPALGYVMCGTELCYQPSQGEVCCDPSQNWGCPSDSFCLVDGKCCEDGFDPETCARNQGVTLPSDWTSIVPVAPSTAPPAASSMPVPTPGSLPPYSSVETTVPPSSATTAIAPYPTGANTTVPTTGAITPTASSNLPPVFSGAANKLVAGIGAGLLAVGGLVL